MTVALRFDHFKNDAPSSKQLKDVSMDDRDDRKAMASKMITAG